MVIRSCVVLWLHRPVSPFFRFVPVFQLLTAIVKLVLFSFRLMWLPCEHLPSFFNRLNRVNASRAFPSFRDHRASGLFSRRLFFDYRPELSLRLQEHDCAILFTFFCFFCILLPVPRFSAALDAPSFFCYEVRPSICSLRDDKSCLPFFFDPPARTTKSES